MILGLQKKEADAIHSFNCMTRIMKTFGVRESEDKAVWPTMRMEFLGNTVDTVKMTLEVSEHRRKELLELIRVWKTKEWCSLKELQSLIGKLAFVMNCVRPGRIFISRLLSSLQTFPDRKLQRVSQEILEDLDWWERFLPGFSRTSILWLQDCLKIDKFLATDASL